MQYFFKTLSEPSPEVLLKEKKSKFFGYALPITSEDDIKLFLDDVAKRHSTAGHICYAWQLGVETLSYRINDDGEPNNSAGKPIYGQIKAFELTNVLIAVARYFGGTKLGVGGLIQAYRETAKLAIEATEIVERTILLQFDIAFGYEDMNKVMTAIKKYDANIVSQKLELDCRIRIEISKARGENFKSTFENYPKIELYHIS